MPRMSIARSVRLLLLALAAILTALAAIGVSSLYHTRQAYESRLAATYSLEAGAAKLLAASVLEEATERTVRGPRARAKIALSRVAFDAAARNTRALAADDPQSAALVDKAIVEEAGLRDPHAPARTVLAARDAIARLAERQVVRRHQARSKATDDSRGALVAVIAGGGLALLAVLGLVAGLLAALRRPLDELVRAASALSTGNLGARVSRRGPAELQTLAGAFNHMAQELEQALAAIQAERERLGTIVESVADGLVVVDRNGRVTTVNPAAVEMLPALGGAAALSAEALALPPLEQAIEEEVVLERDGLTLAVTAAQLAGDTGAQVWTIRDTTARARLERLKSEFVATASHELRSPLTSIKGFVELLGQSELDEREREFVEIINLSANRLVDLVNDLLDVARVEAGEMEIHRRECDLAAVVDEVARLMRPRIEEKNQRLDLVVDADAPPAFADPARMRQVVTNLLTNAHLYTDAGGVLTVAIGAAGDGVALTVSDTGAGMSVEHIDSIFERFYRGPEASKSQGTGLGLAIVKSLVDMHEGRIAVRSEPGAGTVFEIVLPAAAAPGVDLRRRRDALRGRTVLVVDDEEDIASLITARLEPHGVQCEWADSGQDAIARLRERRFDAVTLDILMPGMSGFEVLRAMRADPALVDLPVVVVSVFSGREALAGEWSVGKPIDADELTDTLATAVLAGRTRVIAVGRPAVHARLERSLASLHIDHRWVTSAEAVARACANERFEVALIDGGMEQARPAIDALDLRGRRRERSVIVFGADDTEMSAASFGASHVPIDQAGEAVLALLGAAEAP